MKKKIKRQLATFLCLGVLITAPVSAQLNIGQYEDEAPFRTWNTFGISTASALGMGETQFASVADPSASLVNPARLTALSQFSIALHGSYTSASFDKYSIVNTGVLITEGNSAMGLYGIDFVGASFGYKGWALGFGVGLAESYDRPSQNPDYQSGGQVLYLLEFEQTGYLRNYNISLARKIGEWLSLGLGFNYVSGSMEKRVVENLFYSGVTISDIKTHAIKGFYLNGGLVADVTAKLRIAGVFRSPYTKDSESESFLRYDSPQGNTDIRIEASAENGYSQPLVLGIGVDYRFSPRFRAASDVTYFNWASYAIDYFSEEIDKEFKNTIKISGGFEYLAAVRLFQQEVQVPLRAGAIYDPQPVLTPDTHYVYFTFGLGMYWKRLHLDAGAMFGSEKGSGSNLYGRKFAFTLSYHI
jgi:hypothetical protein